MLRDGTDIEDSMGEVSLRSLAVFKKFEGDRKAGKPR